MKASQTKAPARKHVGGQEQKHKKHVHKGNHGTKEPGLLQGEKLLGVNLSRFQNCKKRPKNAQQSDLGNIKLSWFLTWNCTHTTANFPTQFKKKSRAIDIN
jgi:hypothetical protein